MLTKFEQFMRTRTFLKERVPVLLDCVQKNINCTTLQFYNFTVFWSWDFSSEHRIPYGNARDPFEPDFWSWSLSSQFFSKSWAWWVSDWKTSWFLVFGWVWCLFAKVFVFFRRQRPQSKIRHEGIPRFAISSSVLAGEVLTPKNHGVKSSQSLPQKTRFS